jgi:hypothetical protein
VEIRLRLVPGGEDKGGGEATSMIIATPPLMVNKLADLLSCPLIHLPLHPEPSQHIGLHQRQDYFIFGISIIYVAGDRYRRMGLMWL